MVLTLYDSYSSGTGKRTITGNHLIWRISRIVDTEGPFHNALWYLEPTASKEQSSIVLLCVVKIHQVHR